MRALVAVGLVVVASCTKEGKPTPPVATTTPAADAAPSIVDASSASAPPADAGFDAAFEVASDTADDSTDAKVGAWEVSVLALPGGKTDLVADGKVTKMTKDPAKGWIVAIGADTFHLGLPSRVKPAFAVGDEIHVAIQRSHRWHAGLDGSVLDAAGEPLVLTSNGGLPPKSSGDFRVTRGAARTTTTTEGRKKTSTHDVRFVHVSGKQAIVRSGDVRRLVTAKGTFVVSGTSVSVEYTSGPIPPETSGSFQWTILRER